MFGDSKLTSPIEEELDFLAIFYSKFANLQLFLSEAEKAGFLKFVSKTRAKQIFDDRLEQEAGLEDILNYRHIERLDNIFKAKGRDLYKWISKEAFGGRITEPMAKKIVEYLSEAGLVKIGDGKIKPTAKYSKLKASRKMML